MKEEIRTEDNGSVKDDNGPSPDPFDLDAIRRSQNYHERTGVKKRLQVKVRKPSKEWWFQVHPDENYRIDKLVIELKEDQEIYWIHPELEGEFEGDPCCVFKRFVTCITRQGNVFLWHIRLPDSDGKLDDYNTSALGYAADIGKWQRIYANRQLSMYDQELTTRDWADPEWPVESFQEIVRTAFRSRIVDSMEHAVIERLMGK